MGPLSDAFSEVRGLDSWYANIKAVEWETPRPLAVGSRLAFLATLLGRRLSYTYEIRELVPGERLVMSTAQGPGSSPSSGMISACK